MKRRSYKVRLPVTLVRRLKEAANRNGTSLNQEITTRIQDSFDVPPLVEVLRFVSGMAEFIEANERASEPPKGKQPHAVGGHG